MSHREWLKEQRGKSSSERETIPAQCVWKIPKVMDEESGIEGEYGCEQCIVRLREQTGRKLHLKANGFDDLCDFCFPDDIPVAERLEWLRERHRRKKEKAEETD